jgi:hypothetical protein
MKIMKLHVLSLLLVGSFNVLGTECKIKNKDLIYSKPGDSVNKLSFPEADNLLIERAGLIINSYPVLHLQFPVLVTFEYE